MHQLLRNKYANMQANMHCKILITRHHALHYKLLTEHNPAFLQSMCLTVGHFGYVHLQSATRQTPPDSSPSVSKCYFYGNTNKCFIVYLMHSEHEEWSSPRNDTYKTLKSKQLDSQPIKRRWGWVAKLVWPLTNKRGGFCLYTATVLICSRQHRKMMWNNGLFRWGIVLITVNLKKPSLLFSCWIRAK